MLFFFFSFCWMVRILRESWGGSIFFPHPYSISTFPCRVYLKRKENGSKSCTLPHTEDKKSCLCLYRNLLTYCFWESQDLNGGTRLIITYLYILPTIFKHPHSFSAVTTFFFFILKYSGSNHINSMIFFPHKCDNGKFNFESRMWTMKKKLICYKMML